MARIKKAQNGAATTLRKGQYKRLGRLDAKNPLKADRVADRMIERNSRIERGKEFVSGKTSSFSPIRREKLDMERFTKQTATKVKKSQYGSAVPAPYSSPEDKKYRLKSYDRNYKTKFEWEKGKSEPSRITERRTLKGLLKGAPKAAGKMKLESGGKVKDKKWIQKAVNPKHKGYCTPMTKATCTPKRKALAQTFKRMAAKRKGK